MTEGLEFDHGVPPSGCQVLLSAMEGPLVLAAGGLCELEVPESGGAAAVLLIVAVVTESGMAELVADTDNAPVPVVAAPVGYTGTEVVVVMFVTASERIFVVMDAAVSETSVGLAEKSEDESAGDLALETVGKPVLEAVEEPKLVMEGSVLEYAE